MNMKYLLACGVAAVSIGAAMADPAPTVFPHGIAGAANVMTSAGAVQGTLSDTVTKAQGSVQQSTANQPNGYAKLDGSGNVTLPVTGSVAAAPADASGDTVSTIASTAKSGSALAATAVQKSQVGAANGVAPLDANKMMPAAVSGDTSQSPVTAQSLNGTPTGTSLVGAIADNAYVHSLGSKNVGADGTISPEKLGSILRSAVRPLSLRISSGESIPAGQSSTIALPSTMANSVMINADGQLFSSSDEVSTNAAWNGGNESKHIGDGVLVQSFEPRWGIMRDREYNDSSIFDYMTHRAPAGITSDFYTQNAQWVEPDECKSTSDPNYNAWWCDVSNNKTTVHSDNISNSSIVGVNGRKMDFYSSGQGHYKSDDVGDWIRMNISGTNWSWSVIREMIETQGLSIGGFTDSSGNPDTPGFQRYLHEWDMAGVGNDLSTSPYNPLNSARHAVWMTPYSAGGLTTWKASTSVAKYQILLVTNATNNTTYMYENTVDGAVTGMTQPTWAFNETAPVSDGTASWVFMGVKRFQIGCMMCVGGGDDGEFGSLIASNAPFYDAPIDLSMATYDTTYSAQNAQAVMRTATNTFFDLSANATKAGQNNHLLGYGTYKGIGWNTLEYVVNGSTVFHVNDDGVVGSATTRVKASGTTIDDATATTTAITDIYDADADNAGVVIKVAGPGEEFKIYNNTKHLIKLYPYNGSWSINGSYTFYTMQPGELVTGYPGFNNTLNMRGTSTSTNMSISGSLYLGRMTKAAILALTSPIEGQIVFNTDNHTEEVYRCPASTACGWYAPQYGTALSQ